MRHTHGRIAAAALSLSLVLAGCQGAQVAQRVYQRHRLLTRVFMTLGVSEETASADACKIEHDLSEETFRCILEHARRHLDDLPGEQ